MSGRGLSPEWYAGVRGTFPYFGNTFEYNYVREKWAPTVSAFRGSESATSYLTWNILDDLAYFSNLQEAKVGFERAKYEYIKEKQDVLVEVKDTYFAYRKSLLNMGASEAQVTHQRMFVRLMEERLKLGEIEFYQLMDEFAKLVEQEYGLIQSHADYYISLVNLNKAVGVSDYFVSEYEGEEYAEWEKELGEKRDAGEKVRREDEVRDLLRKARAYLSAGKYDMARKYADKALAADPDSVDAKNFQQEIIETENTKEKARREAEEKSMTAQMAKKKAREEARLAREKAKAEAKAKREAEREAKRKAKEQGKKQKGINLLSWLGLGGAKRKAQQ
jgi:tetratricopeptide (TPR) repeat protein